MQSLITNLKSSFKKDTLESLYKSTSDIYIYLDEHFNYLDGKFEKISNKTGNEFLESLKSLADNFIKNNENNNRFPYLVCENINKSLENITFPLNDEDLEGYLTNVLILFEDISEEIADTGIFTEMLAIKELRDLI